MQTDTTTVTTADGPMAVYRAVPDRPAACAVIVVQEAFGVNDHIEDVTRRFARLGYLAVAPHLFHRTGGPVIPYGRLDEVMPHFGALSEGGVLDDLDACLGLLADAGVASGQVAVVGFCMGGTVAFLAAARRVVGAAVTFYGGGIAEGRFGSPSLVTMAADLRTPWLGLYGDQDQGIPVADVEALRTATAAAPIATEVVRYPDAGHGFHCDQRPDSYEAASAADAWRRTVDWIEGHLRR